MINFLELTDEMKKLTTAQLIQEKVRLSGWKIIPHFLNSPGWEQLQIGISSDDETEN